MGEIRGAACHHGQLARSCNVCELETEVASLRTQVATLTEQRNASQRVLAALDDDVVRLARERDEAQCQVATLTRERDEARRLLGLANDGRAQLEGWRDSLETQLAAYRAALEVTPENVRWLADRFALNQSHAIDVPVNSHADELATYALRAISTRIPGTAKSVDPYEKAEAAAYLEHPRPPTDRIPGTAGGEAAKPSGLYYLLSVKWTRGDLMTWWAPDCRGYVIRLSDAGKYTEAQARKQLDPRWEPSDGLPDVVAVPCEAVESAVVGFVPLCDATRPWMRGEGEGVLRTPVAGETADGRKP